MAILKLYKSYMFTGRKDPVIDKIRTAMQDRGASYEEIAAASGVSRTTLRNWFEGDTCRPQYATVAAALGGMGYELVVQERSAAKVVPIHARMSKPSR
jgi:transcriptional regulator with XRE-family HTH domain